MAGKRRVRMSASNRRGMIAIAGVVAVLLVVFALQSRDQMAKNEAYREQAASLQEDLQDEEVRAREIEDLKDYVKTDEFIEKIAREKLGLVYEDEIVFRPKE